MIENNIPDNSKSADGKQVVSSSPPNTKVSNDFKSNIINKKECLLSSLKHGQVENE